MDIRFPPRRSLLLRSVIALAIIAAAQHTVRATEPSFPADQLEFFEKDVRPLLATHCYECHGPNKQNGNLRLDHRSFVLQGGDSGPALVPGKSDESLLVEAINYASYEMPPTGRLSPEQVAVLTKWVELGAPWPDETAAQSAAAKDFDLESRKAHWSFQPIASVALPDVGDASWPRDELDRFVLAKLEAAGLRPAEDADKRTLIRRVYFDLVGLPPSPDHVAAFLADDSPQAFATVVDELLASPQFGVRWGRHWLDLVRYADTLGHEFDYPLPHAWRYRDYVVRAFNTDVPYDDLVREHIAGDLLAEPRLHPTEGTNESIIGTGFWHLHDDVHAPVDVRAAEATRYDNQIDVFGKAFLGLTIACARCHDHKFDPITAADYYAIAGFLKSSRRQDAYLDPHGKITEIATKLEALRNAADVEPVSTVEPDSTPTAPIREGDFVFEDFNTSPDDWYATGWAFGKQTARNHYGIVDSSRLAKPLVGALRSPNFTIEHDAVLLRVAAVNARVRLVVDGYQMDLFQPLLFKDLTQSVDTGGEWTWLRIAGDLPNHKGRRGYIELLDDGDGWIAVDEIRFTNSPDDPQPTAARVAGPEGAARGPGDRASTSGTRPAGLVPASLSLSHSIPAPIRIHAMADGPACDEELFIRGNHENTSGPVPRRFLEAIDAAPVASKSCGRLELANRLLDDSNPFPARVMVNRVWQHLFGEGIVKSVDNFGVLGEVPTHPELLDRLASDFRNDGWSVKRLIRRIVLSRSYRMASIPHPETASKIADTDPANTLLHSQRVKRLEGEALRDAMLAVSGRLDPTPGGEPVPIHLTSFMQGRGRPGQSGPLDGDGRRSLYLKVQRNFLIPMLTAFDFPVPATTVGRRNVSNVPAQALILLNDPFVIDQATVWAHRTLAISPATPSDRVHSLYEAAYTRSPTPEETASAFAFLEAHGENWPTNVAAWANLCHVLFNGKEFVFVP